MRWDLGVVEGSTSAEERISMRFISSSVGSFFGVRMEIIQQANDTFLPSSMSSSPAPSSSSSSLLRSSTSLRSSASSSSKVLAPS